MLSRAFTSTLTFILIGSASLSPFIRSKRTLAAFTPTLFGRILTVVMLGKEDSELEKSPIPVIDMSSGTFNPFACAA